MFSALRVSS
uniref:Uncharacterized protein n=1 Tax=Anguilla anguilla TaxID=7936 RepID=A0A0E9R477_ANGAN